MTSKNVIVIGSGISGLVSAILARKKGHSVKLITYGQGALSVAGGIIDLIGYDYNGNLIKNPLEYIKTLPCKHPYSLIGVDHIKDGVEAFLQICRECNYEYVGSPFKNQMILTAVGTLKPTCLTPKTIDGSLLKSHKRLCVVGFDILKDFFVDIVVENLKRHYGNEKIIDSVTVNLNMKTGVQYRDISALDVARLLDDKIGFLNVVEQLKQKGSDDTLFIMPPVISEKPSYDIYKKLQDYTNASFMEVSAIPPSVTGYRLDVMLLNYAKKLGVDVIEKSKVAGSAVDNGHCVSIYTQGVDRDREYKADAFILATGGVFGGGLIACMGAMYEPIFKLPIKVPHNQQEWSNQYLFEGQEQKFATFGLKTNDNLQIINDDMEVLIDNVYVVGRSLQGYDFCFEKSGNGVAICSAYHAIEQL